MPNSDHLPISDLLTGFTSSFVGGPLPNTIQTSVAGRIGFLCKTEHQHILHVFMLIIDRHATYGQTAYILVFRLFTNIKQFTIGQKYLVLG